MTKDNYSTNIESQRERLLAYLLTSPCTTLQARKELDILHPAGRVQELREQGYKIVTVKSYEHTDKATHKVARYVLLAGV